MKKLYDEIGIFLKKAGERLTTGLLEEMCVIIPPERRFETRNLFVGLIVNMKCQMLSRSPAVAFTLIHRVADPKVSGIVHPAVKASLLLRKTSASIPGSMP